MSVAQSKGPEVYLSDATLYLELFGILVIGWQWLKQGTRSESLRTGDSKNYSQEFLMSKLHTVQYYFEYEIPKTEGLATRLKSLNHVTVTAKAEEIV